MGGSVLSRSLRAVSDLPILILTQGDFRPDIDTDGVACLRVPPLLRTGHVFPSDALHLAVTLSKLWVFSLTRPRRVAFLDADCLVLQPIDALFEGDRFAAVPDLFVNYDRPGFNSGVFAFTPSPGLSENLFRDLPKLSVSDGDQGILNVFFPDWRQLPQGFNLLRAHALLRAEARDKALRVVHYTPSKPWAAVPASPRDPLLAPLDDLWTARLAPDQHLALVRDWRARIAAVEANIASWMDAGAARRRLRQERHQRRWIIALAFIQLLQASLLAGLLLR